MKKETYRERQGKVSGVRQTGGEEKEEERRRWAPALGKGGKEEGGTEGFSYCNYLFIII